MASGMQYEKNIFAKFYGENYFHDSYYLYDTHLSLVLYIESKSQWMFTSQIP